jgi:hypothetical protein
VDVINLIQYELRKLTDRLILAIKKRRRRERYRKKWRFLQTDEQEEQKKAVAEYKCNRTRT